MKRYYALSESSQIVKRQNKVKISQENRLCGKEYVNPSTQKTVLTRRQIKPPCNGSTCYQRNKMCKLLTEEERTCINQEFYNTKDLQLQREYIVRHIKVQPIKQRTVSDHPSRRNNSIFYFLPKTGEPISVCKQMFLNTLNISEKTFRTAVRKLQPTGVFQNDKREGKVAAFLEKDRERREILSHINRFLRMESHYCHEKSKRDYLHPELNKVRMFKMFQKEHPNIRASYSMYCDMLKSLNISFHNPKKDQCQLCENYRKGDTEKKIELEEKFQKHNMEKETVRRKKEEAKKDENQYNRAVVFDLQQVIHLPITDDNQIFYKRRLATYNFTIYELKEKNCHCFLWHEGQGKRGSCEISSCVNIYLKSLDNQEIKEVTLFADGCPGQNKNSITAAMLLHFIKNSASIEKIYLNFFETNHSQSEGDSAHSAISTAIKNTGDLYVPAQLVPIIRLARRKNPYIVHSLQFSDFLDFKTLSQNLRILNRRNDDNGCSINWTAIMELMVKKNDSNKIFFKMSHASADYRTLTLTQNIKEDHLLKPLSPLYKEQIKITKAKYDDLNSLCTGNLPVIRINDYANFYKGLNY